MIRKNSTVNTYGEIMVGERQAGSFSGSTGEGQSPSFSVTVTDKELWHENEDGCISDVTDLLKELLA